MCSWIHRVRVLRFPIVHAHARTHAHAHIRAHIVLCCLVCSRVCSRCADGYWRHRYSCHKCSKHANVWLPIAYVLVSAALVFYLFRIRTSGGLVKIVFFHFQILNMLMHDDGARGALPVVCVCVIAHAALQPRLLVSSRARSGTRRARPCSNRWAWSVW